MTEHFARAFAAGRQGRTDEPTPVQGSATLAINAPTRVVFDTLADLTCWPVFFPGITHFRVHGDEPLAAGTRFRWRNSGFPIASTIRRWEPPAEITWTGRSQWLTAVHRNLIEPLPEGRCRLTSTERMSGFAVQRMTNSVALSRQLARFVEAIAREAEHRSTVAR